MTHPPAADRGSYPPTLWSWYRETGMPWVLAPAFVALAVAALFHIDWLVQSATVVGGLLLVSGLPVLYLERHADLRYDREHAIGKEARS